MSKLKVLQLISSLEEFSGGSNTLYLLSRGLTNRGHKVTVACFTKGYGPLVKKLEDLNIRVLNLGWGKDVLNSTEKLKLLWRLRRLAENMEIDVLHCHHCDADVYGVVSVFPKRIKKIITVHSTSYISWAIQHWVKYNYFIFPQVDRFVCVSKYLSKELSGQFKTIQKKISTIRNAPPQEFLLPEDKEKRQKFRKEFNISEKDFLVGHIGSFSWYRKIEHLFEAIGKIDSQSLKLILVGSGSKDKIQEFKQLAKNKFIQEKVIFAGFREDIPVVLDALDLLVSPSVEESDGWAVTEAMSKSKPIIVYEVGGIPEKIINGQTGILIPVSDISALTNAINWCFKNYAAAQKMGLKAKKYIENNLIFEVMIKEYEDLYVD